MTMEGGTPQSGDRGRLLRGMAGGAGRVYAFFTKLQRLLVLAHLEQSGGAASWGKVRHQDGPALLHGVRSGIRMGRRCFMGVRSGIRMGRRCFMGVRSGIRMGRCP